MKLGLASIVCLLGAVGVAAQVPMPIVQNGQVRVHPATSVDAAVRAVPASTDPAWLGWREPMVDGGRRVCSTWSDSDTVVRGMLLEPRGATGDGRPQLAPSQAPTSLEAGTGVVVLLRLVDGKVERLRTMGDDCPIDANGRTIEWLTITPAESLRYLSTLAQATTMTNDVKRLAQSAASAIALHRDLAADAILDRLVSADAEGDRDNAWRLLAGYRGKHGYDMVARAITAERNATTRQRLVAALRQSSEPAAMTTLLSLAKTDPSEHVRAEAVFGYATLAGATGLANVLEIATKDTSPEVQRRAVSGVARLPPSASVPALLSLARTSAVPAVRKEAVGALSRMDDPRATAYLEELVGK
ncbi:MAG: HEAT repeat domain-containing protein [Acidobacteriota bacterium]